MCDVTFCDNCLLPRRSVSGFDPYDSVRPSCLIASDGYKQTKTTTNHTQRNKFNQTNIHPICLVYLYIHITHRYTHTRALF
jgi:hypothetical protein